MRDILGKFDTKYDEGIFIGYTTLSKYFRVFNKITLTIGEFFHVTFDENNLKYVEVEVVDCVVILGKTTLEEKYKNQ